jgi:hypothetical protein
MEQTATQRTKQFTTLRTEQFFRERMEQTATQRTEQFTTLRTEQFIRERTEQAATWDGAVQQAVI